MTINKSMGLSQQIISQLHQNLLGVFSSYFPYHHSEKYTKSGSRNRIFSQTDTLLTMINTAVQSDKSESNSVNIFRELHQTRMEYLAKQENELRQTSELSVGKRGKGRPRKYYINVPKSKLKTISQSTSAYSQSKHRLDLDYVKEVFTESSLMELSPDKYNFHGRKVFITDGTYLQLQDTDAIKNEYNQSMEDKYPRGLLSVIISQSSGQICDFRLRSDKKSELDLVIDMTSDLQPGSLLLADDLYNCFAIFSILSKKSVDIIVPGKRVRNYELVEVIAPGDEIVRIKNSTRQKSKISKRYDVTDDEVILRRIEFADINDPTRTLVLYTSILDKNITKLEIIQKYYTRWDIEICIREIKNIMDINTLRSKTPIMALKELYTVFIAYNYIRQLISSIALESDFSPERGIFYKLYTSYTTTFYDKLGRVYSKKSSGRPKEIK